MPRLRKTQEFSCPTRQQGFCIPPSNVMHWPRRSSRTAHLKREDGRQGRQREKENRGRKQVRGGREGGMTHRGADYCGDRDRKRQREREVRLVRCFCLNCTIRCGGGGSERDVGSGGAGGRSHYLSLSPQQVD